VDDPSDMVLASDGTPIGVVASAPNGSADDVTYAPAEFDDRTGYVRRIERAMAAGKALDLTDKNEPQIPDSVVDTLLPGYRDSAKREKALAMYVTGDYSLHDVAQKIGVPDRTVAKWAEVGDWIRFQEQITETLKRHERVRLTAIRVQNRERLMKEQLELGGAINKKAKQQLKDDVELTPGQLKMAAEAAKLGSDMTNRALGIGESGNVDGEKKKESTATVSLVNIFKTGGIPEVESRGEVIDVQSTGQDQPAQN